MKILVINSDCVQVNSSANLCHLAYLRGLLDSGHDVSLLCAEGRDYVTDDSMAIPDEIHQYVYYGVSLYEKLSLRKKKISNTSIGNNHAQESKERNVSFSRKLLKRTKAKVLSLYGVHGIYGTFVRKAQKFSSTEKYDYVLSISTPPASHLLAHNLIHAGHIECKHWIQIWEDPWYSDLYLNNNNKIFKEEKKLLAYAEKVCYVSPLTLKNQQKLFPESASKMYWQPLPYYYKNGAKSINVLENSYGYFGDYVPITRNLRPFYEAAVNNGIKVNICGNPSNLFDYTENIHIYPRLLLSELKPIEDATNVLIFLCNLKGGQIPGKIYQYSATNKTILFILDGTDEEKEVLKSYFEPFNRYVFCENTVEDITRAIKLIEAGDFGTVENKPVESFNPKETIRKILEEGK